MADQSRRPAFFWLVLLLCGAYAGFCAVTIEATLRHYGTEKDPGWNVRADATGWIVSDVNASGPAAGRIEPGDRLIALNGDGRAAVLGTANWADLRAGDTYRVDLERRGTRVSYHLPISTVGRRKMYPIFGLCGLAWFVVGAGLAFARPDDRQVRLVGLTLMLVGFFGLNEMLGSVRTFLVGWERTVYWATSWRHCGCSR